jgi:hypothetical protein
MELHDQGINAKFDSAPSSHEVNREEVSSSRAKANLQLPFEREIVDQYVRLLVAADHVSKLLAQHMQAYAIPLLVSSNEKSLRRFATRFDEQRLDLFCDQLLHLCIVALNTLLDFGATSSSTVQPLIESELISVTCKQLMNETAYIIWVPLLRREIDDFIVMSLPDIARQLLACPKKMWSDL